MTYGDRDMRHHYNQNSFVNRLFEGRRRKDFTRFGLSAKDLLKENADPKLMLRCGFSVRELYDSGADIEELADAGVKVSDFKKAKISSKELMDGMEECRRTLFSLKEIADCYGIDAIRKGCGMSDLKGLYGLRELLETFSPEEICGGDNVASLLKAGFKIYDIWGAGYSTEQLRDADVSLSQQVDAGIPMQEIRRAFPSIDDFIQAGFRVPVLKEAGFTPKEMAGRGFPAKDFVDAMYVLDDLKGLFPKEELILAGFDASDF